MSVSTRTGPSARVATRLLEAMAAAPAMVLQAERCASEGESPALAEILTEKESSTR